jgi:ubiquinone/menaquinone biosynthesis C-methylase UbiE
MATTFQRSQLFHGFYAVPAITMFAELGVVRRWLDGETVDLRSMCERDNLDPDVVMSLANYFVLYDYLVEQADGYVSTELGKAAFQTWNSGMIHFAYSSLNSNIISLARKEKTYGYGKEVYRDLYYDTKGSGSLGTDRYFKPIVDYLKRLQMTRLADFGCGNGTFLGYAASTFPSLRVVGIDQSAEILKVAQTNLENAGVADRAQFVQGDLMRPTDFASHEAMRGVDIATISFILHEITYDGTDLVVQFLRTYKEAFGKSKLAVTELYRQRESDFRKNSFKMHSGAPESILNHDLSKQKVLYREQWLEIYELAGFRIVESLQQIPPGEPMIETLVVEAR